MGRDKLELKDRFMGLAGKLKAHMDPVIVDLAVMLYITPPRGCPYPMFFVHFLLINYCFHFDYSSNDRSIVQYK